MKLKKAYSYIRFSRLEQKKGSSYNRQIERAKKYAKENGYKLDDSIVYDEGTSAFKGKNKTSGALSIFLKKIETGKIKEGSLLIIENFDRLTREDIDAAHELIRKILLSGIKIATLTDGRLYNKDSLKDPLSLISIIFIAARAHEESSLKSQRVSDAWARKRKNLLKEGKILTHMLPSWIKYDKKAEKFEIIKSKAKIIRNIYDLANSGLGKTKIMKQLNQKGIKPFRGELWATSSIQKILRNRQLIGEFQPHRLLNGKRLKDGPPIPDYFPRVLDDNVFYKTQGRKIIKGPQRVDKISNIFTGLLKCGICGASMLYVNKGKWQYLVCDTAKKGGKCSYISTTYKTFESAILNNLLERLNVGDGEEEGVVSEIAISKRNINEANDVIFHKKKQLERLMLAYAGSDNEEIKEAYNNLNKDLTADIDQNKKIIIEERQRLSKLEEASAGLKDELNEIAKLSQDNSINTRKKLRNAIREIIESIVIFPAGGNLKNGKIISKTKLQKKGSMQLYHILYIDGKESLVTQPKSHTNIPNKNRAKAILKKLL